MFIETIKTPGLAHLSYVLGSANEAVVIDPRRDVERYIDIAEQNECRIHYIFETHRNEDLISGSPILSKLSGAEVLHGPNPLTARFNMLKRSKRGSNGLLVT